MPNSTKRVRDTKVFIPAPFELWIALPILLAILTLELAMWLPSSPNLEGMSDDMIASIIVTP